MIDTDLEVLAGELIDDGEHPHLPVIDGVVELEVHGPQSVRGDQRHGTDVGTDTGQSPPLADPCPMLPQRPAEVLARAEALVVASGTFDSMTCVISAAVGHDRKSPNGSDCSLRRESSVDLGVCDLGVALQCTDVGRDQGLDAVAESARYLAQRHASA